MIVDDHFYSNVSNLQSNLTEGGRGDSNAKKKKRINPTIINQ